MAKISASTEMALQRLSFSILRLGRVRKAMCRMLLSVIFVSDSSRPVRQAKHPSSIACSSTSQTLVIADVENDKYSKWDALTVTLSSISMSKYTGGIDELRAMRVRIGILIFNFRIFGRCRKKSERFGIDLSPRHSNVSSSRLGNKWIL